MRLGRLAAALAFAGVSVLPGAAAAQAPGFERIRAYDVEIDVLPSGRIHVVETIDYSFGTLRRHGILRHIPVRFHYDGTYDRVYPLKNVRVTGSPGTPVQTEVKGEGDSKVIRIGDPDREINGDHRYVIAYDVDGSVNRFESHDELFWNAVGHEWPLFVGRSTVTVRSAVPVGEVACFAGADGARARCDTARAQGTTATFAHGKLSPFEGLSVVVGLPAGHVAEPGPVLDERWSADKAFSRGRRQVALAVLTLCAGLGGVAALVGRGGRDRQFAGLIPGLDPVVGETAEEEPVPFVGRGEVSVDFEPGDDMRPALMGVLIDERADPLDVTATIVDLAVRRYLTIEELPRKGLFRKRDWKLTYLGGPAEGLAPWESRLVGALFPSGDVTMASQLKNRFFSHLREIQSDLYDDVVARGWFRRRPDAVRSWWSSAGTVAALAGAGVTYLLARYTTLGLTGIALVLAGLALRAAGPRMPYRTARGTAALDRARAFRRYLVTAEANQLRFEEKEGLFARYLPYAVVFGETERWANAFKDLGARAEQELYWYSGPSGWSAVDFGDSISSFSTHTAGTIASTPSSASGGSGFSGGGSSGGGGGGGGGGSW